MQSNNDPANSAFYKILDASPVPYALNDHNNNITYLNTAFKKTFGYDTSDLSKLDQWWPLAYPDPEYRKWVKETWETNILMARKNKLPFEPVELNITCKNKTVKTVTANAEFLEGIFENNHLVILQDITEKKQNIKIFERLSQIESALNIAGMGIHFVRPDGKLLYVNNAAASLLGYEVEEMIKLSISDIDPNFIHEDFGEISRHLMDKPGRMETIQKTKHGELIPVEVIFYYIKNHDKQSGHFISFINDLRERIKNEEEKIHLQKQLYQSQKMESIGHLTGGIAHDFNNILSIIMGYGELIKNLAEENASSTIQKDLVSFTEEILKASHRAKDLISKLLIFSKLTPDKKQNEITRIKQELGEIMQILAPFIPSYIRIQTSLENPDLNIAMNPISFQQIIMNMVLNSVKAIKKQGEITIHIADEKPVQDYCQSCHHNFTGEYIMLEVKDSGEGIEDSIRARIFDPFFTTRSVGEGSGMGLAVVHGIVHSLNGHICIESEKDKGCSIKIYLPSLNTELKTNPPIEQNVPDENTLSGLKILIVDDNKSLTNSLEKILQHKGAETVSFNDPFLALKYALENINEFDVMITDKAMPGMTGIELSQKLLQKKSSLRIILCTGYSKDVNDDRIREAGISESFMKPVSTEDLIQAIRKLTEQS